MIAFFGIISTVSDLFLAYFWLLSSKVKYEGTIKNVMVYNQHPVGHQDIEEFFGKVSNANKKAAISAAVAVMFSSVAPSILEFLCS